MIFSIKIKYLVITILILILAIVIDSHTFLYNKITTLFNHNKKLVITAIDDNNNDNIHTFECNINDKVKFLQTTVWTKDNDEWEKIEDNKQVINSEHYLEKLIYNFEISLDLQENMYSLQSNINKNTKNIYIPIQVDFSDTSTTENFFSSTQEIVLGEEIILFQKYGFKDKNNIEFNFYDSFKEIQCDKAVVVTINFLSE